MCDFFRWPLDDFLVCVSDTMEFLNYQHIKTESRARGAGNFWEFWELIFEKFEKGA